MVLIVTSLSLLRISPQLPDSLSNDSKMVLSKIYRLERLDLLFEYNKSKKIKFIVYLLCLQT